jgi:glycosyltransferase involved in cell wall biosynthesis
MKIGFDGKRAFSNKTGLGNYSRFILKNLVVFQKKYEILAFASKYKEGLFPEFPKNQIIAFKLKIFASFWRSFLLPNLFQKHKIDIYHGLSNELPFFVNTSKAKLIVTIHDLIFLRFPALYNPIDRFIYTQKYKYACSKAHLIIAISEQTKRDIVHYFGTNEEKIKVVYQNCDEIFYKKLERENIDFIKQKYKLQKPFFLCVGTIEERKNQLNLVNAFEKSKVENFELILVGRGKAYKSEVQEYILAKQISNTKILSDVPTEDLPALYQAAHAFAYVSFFEGFGIPIVEALASEIPIIAATGSCLEEAGGDAAIYVDPNNIDKMAEAINSMAIDQNLRNKLIVNGKKQILKFQTKKLMGEMMEVYEGMM